MTALDKVFIKAYGKSKQAAVAEPARSTPSRGRRIDAAHPSVTPPASEAAEVAVVEVPVSIAPLAATFQPPDRGRIDARHDMPRPHWPAMKALATAPAAPAPAVATPAALPAWAAPTPLVAVEVVEQAAPAAIVAPPVSSASTVNSPPPTPPAPPPVLESVPTQEGPSQHVAQRAAFEVDRFLWPEICRQMMAGVSWSDASRELAAASREGQQVFVIASQQRGEGRSTLALCLAQRLAEKKLRVTLVDADFHRPQLARSLKLLPAAGWDEVLRGSLPLTESWIESVEDGVTLLPLKEGADTTGLIGNSRLKEQFSLLRRMNDVVLIDAGSLEDFSDREVLALLGGTAQIDGAILVRDVRKTTTDGLQQAAKCLDALGIARVDVVENFSRS